MTGHHLLKRRGGTPISEDMRHICNRCLRLWHPRRDEQRSSCPRCGGALRPH
jgi:hypothetical protein